MFMKRKYNLLLVLIAMFFFFSSLVGVYRILPTVEATYIEGTITQDTDWTAVDSPFIVSNNVTVNPGVTLTVEPGVQVRFGDNFWITVNGKIIADGTDDRTILFTSDNPNASVGSWGTILINGTQQSSITHCIIEYGTNGITLEGGSLNLQNNLVRFDSNGIIVNGGSIVASNNEITNNTMSGINVAGGNQVTIENNIVSSNGDGIVLTGDLAGTIDITQNNILLNGQSGIFLESGAYSDTTILQNNISLNSYGFRVATNASTYISRNYISNNTVGIFYENGNGHEAHFNDIHDNSVGMDASSNATVNAAHNYWGNKSGPFHSSLNPDGKGNSVGGDGVNLDFIFFLSASIDYNNAAPTAVLQTDKSLVAPNMNVTFIGTNSYDDGRVDEYFFDFGDGASGWTTLSLFNHTYSTVGTYTASLSVIDDFAVTSQNVATTTITVQDLTPLSVSMTLGSEVADYHGNVTVTVYVSDESGGVNNADVTLLSLKGGSYSPALGATNATGYFETTFTAPNVTDIAYVRLIATATKTGYADGSCHEYLKVLPLLHIQMTTEPATVKSEETVAVIFHVSGGLDQPIADSSLTAVADNGTLSGSTGFTEIDGSVAFNFTAPYTLSPTNVTITVAAQKSGFTDGRARAIISVMPKVLTVDVTAENYSTISEATVALGVQVTYNLAPVQDANVIVISEGGGNFSQPTGTTDAYGFATFVFTAPQANAPFDIVIMTESSKTGYANGQDSLTLRVSPGNISVQVIASSYAIMPGSNLTLNVSATVNSKPVAGAQVIISADAGNFSAATGFTDSNGTCAFTFNAPSTTVQLPVVISTDVTKNGYIGNGNEITINVIPVAPTHNEEGWPVLTILLIIIPVIIAVIVVVLIKLKVIVVSTEEEDKAE